MRNVLILHGTDSNSEDNWFPWLRGWFINKGYKVWVPDLPKADKPSTKRYNKYILENWQFDKESIIVGHSSGAVAILGILERLPDDLVIDKAIMVAGFKDSLGWESLRGLFVKSFDWKKIKGSCGKFILVHSDDDPYVGLEHGQFLKNKLGGELVLLKGQKHFSVETMGEKYRQFPEILEYMKD